ncbi:hypothetical protein F1880_001850 [Penicillium rolfsii]|nr:hypothetical protein F1880_001850 [Penicillium rolfsii]
MVLTPLEDRVHLPQQKADRTAFITQCSTEFQLLESLTIEQFTYDRVERRFLTIASNALGPVRIPLIAYRSSTPGPVIGITSAIHGNEVNGVAVIQKFFDRLGKYSDDSPLIAGTIIGIPVLNVPGFLDSVRSFDGQDLNRLMPGKIDGAAPQQYAYRLFHDVIMKFDYVFDLHTASAGRQNSLYVRADMSHPEINQLAQRVGPQIIVHNSSPGGSLRGCAQSKGVKALTIEVRLIELDHTDWKPEHLSKSVDRKDDLWNLQCLVALVKKPSTAEYQRTCPPRQSSDMCSKRESEMFIVYWVFSQTAGILQVYKKVADRVNKGELIAEIRSIFGMVIEQIFCSTEDSVVVGIEANPVAKSGNRIVRPFINLT